MTVTINGTTGITNDGGYTGDGVVFADTTPANTLVTTTGGNVGIGTSSPANFGVGYSVLTVQNSSSGIVQASNGTVTNEIATFGTIGLIGTRSNHALGFVSNNTERARIDTSGSLLVGTTSATFAGVTMAQLLDVRTRNSGFGLGVIGNASNTQIQRFFYDTTAVGSINVSGSATTYSTSSDYRLKENVQPMTGALATVAQLKPCTYTWKADGSNGQGFIAHELAEVVPDCVVGQKDAVDSEGNPQYQGIDTSFLVATLTAAIQEQQAIITALTARVEALDARLISLEGTQP